MQKASATSDSLPGAGVPRHVVLHELLPPGDHAALVEWGLSLESHLCPSELLDGGRVDRRGRNSFSLEKGAPMGDWALRLHQRYAELAPQLMEALGVAPFALSDVDIDLVVYNDGSFYGPHIDVASGALRRAAADRVITTVYYFHGEPKGFEGGALRLHSLLPGADGKRAFVDIPPEQNSLVAFAATALHEVLPVRCPSGEFRDSRFAINGWLRRARQEKD